jgi:glucose-1-phosphate cytidylyltransferase
MKTVILAGGLGSRLQEITTVVPKPMIEIGGKPVLWHIMGIFAAQGHKEFCVALGYKGEMIKNYFLNYYHLQRNLTITLNHSKIKVHNDSGNRNKDLEDWIIHLVDTGPETMTGGRIKRLAAWLQDETFLMTYGDGVANVDVRKLIDFHRKHGKLATVTIVRPPARFGNMQLEGDRIVSFFEKPQMGEGWINGGFFVLEPQILDYIEGDETSFERQPLENLAGDGQLMAYKHQGFWQCMDTLRDMHYLEKLYKQGNAPWRTLEMWI